MKLVSRSKQIGLLSTSIVAASFALAPLAGAAATPNNPQSTDQAHIATIITNGDKEISRRLTSLGSLSAKISGATKLSASDKSSLTGQVSAETSGLTTLKAKLDAETTLAGAKADSQSIYNDYRVYALIVPKVELIRTADDQQVVEGKLSDLANKLQTRIASAQKAGKNVSGLQTKLADMKAQTTAAQTISSSIETKVISLQPSDYNSDHAVLTGDSTQLKTAHTDNQAAYADAQSLVSAIKCL